MPRLAATEEGGLNSQVLGVLTRVFAKETQAAEHLTQDRERESGDVKHDPGTDTKFRVTDRDCFGKLFFSRLRSCQINETGKREEVSSPNCVIPCG